ncbi:MAG: hypothetical protein ACRD96_29310, partial [Bryobacteraceae bacterium]
YMEWDRSETIGLAKDSCTICGGEGMRKSRGRNTAPCNCVFRGVFRACYARFLYCLAKEKYMSKVSFVACRGKDRRMTYERLIEDYIADFCLVSRRTLSDFEHRIFRYHFLLGADWRLCCRQMKIDRGTFFHSVYRLEQKLGRVFREIQPYSLFPLDEYFAGRIVGRAAPVIAMPPVESRIEPVRPPLRKLA